jgi:hypothetical protein
MVLHLHERRGDYGEEIWRRGDGGDEEKRRERERRGGRCATGAGGREGMERK